MPRDDYHAERLADYDRRIAELQRSGTFGAAVMLAAVEEAERGASEGEVPVGALVLLENRVIGVGHNLPIGLCDPTAHAEIVVLREASKAVGNYRLLGSTLYVTIEPCAMCAGAMIQARVDRVVYGADDPKGGAVRSYFSIFDAPQVNHRVEAIGGVLADEAAALLRDFFALRR